MPKSTKGYDNLTYEQSKQILEFFMYRLGNVKCDLREELAATLPMAYNAYCGKAIVSVVSTDTIPSVNQLRKWGSNA